MTGGVTIEGRDGGIWRQYRAAEGLVSTAWVEFWGTGVIVGCLLGPGFWRQKAGDSQMRY